MLRKERRLVGAAMLCILAVGLGWPDSGSADSHGSVRFYKLNSKDQFVRLRRIRNADEPGCHDFRGTRDANRFAQVGFAWCTVYSGDKCEAGTEIPAMWRGGRYRTADIDVSQPQVKLLPGSQWYLHESENTGIGSWECRYE